MWLCELPEGCPLSEGVAVTPEAGSKGRAAGAEAAILGGGGDMWGGGAYSFPAPLTPPTCLGSQGRLNSMLGPGCPSPCPQAMRKTQSVGVCCHVGGAARSTGDLGARGGGWGTGRGQGAEGREPSQGGSPIWDPGFCGKGYLLWGLLPPPGNDLIGNLAGHQEPLPQLLHSDGSLSP